MSTEQIEQPIVFGSFRLDLVSEQLWREGQPVRLRPKTFTVLRDLVERAGQLVLQDELLEHVWPGAIVGSAVLQGCIRELRQALGDDPKTPRFIETVHRRGYRFIAPVAAGAAPLQGSGVRGQGSVKEPRQEVEHLPDQAPSLPFPVPRTPFPVLVGREAELAQLQEALQKALRGERQVVFVTGEAGIGKTALIDAFLSGVGQQGTGNREQGIGNRQQAKTGVRDWGLGAGPSSPQTPSVRTPDAGRRTSDFLTPNPRSLIPNPWIARGQCVEQYGAGEAYLPVLEALGRLCRGAEGQPLVGLLRQHAPTWLLQLPWLLETTERETLRREVMGTTRERMLREITEALEVLAAETLLVFVLEDLHWSDSATLDFLSSLARRRAPARLLLIGTYRPVDVIVQEHSLRAVQQELQAHGRCVELSLPLLSEADVGVYLTKRFSGSAQPAATFQALAQALHQRTDGNPLFFINVVNDLVSQGRLGERAGRWELRAEASGIELGAPEGVRQMIERQVERFSAEEQQMLEAASVVGVEFSTAAIAALLEVEAAQVEEQCEGLAKHGRFLSPLGIEEWPDGTIVGRYRFTHALYQSVIYARVGAARRSRLHQRIGERIETTYGRRAGERAAELAVHFEQGRDYRRALGYPEQALQESQAAVALAQELAHPFSLAYTLNYAAGLHAFRREAQTAGERAEAAVMLSTEHGFPQWKAMGMILQGWAAGEPGRETERIAQIQQGVGVFRATGAGLGLSFFLALLAEVYAEGGQIEEGLLTVDEALATVHNNGERFCEAELWRLKGELLLKSAINGPISNRG